MWGKQSTQTLPAQRKIRRWFRCLCVCAILALCFLFYVFYLGSNRWRVLLHHGVHVPSSGRMYWCSGSTTYPFNWLGGSSYASFTISPTDLPKFLAQLTPVQALRTADGGYEILPAPCPIQLSKDGEEGCISPTGRDHMSIQWHTTPGGVHIELWTEWD